MATKNEKYKPYLVFDVEDAIGNPDRFYKGADFNDLSKNQNEADDVVYLGSGSTGTVPNPLKNYTIQLPDGDLTTTALGWAATGEQDSGLYRIGTNDYGYAVNGALLTEWTASAFKVMATLVVGSAEEATTTTGTVKSFSSGSQGGFVHREVTSDIEVFLVSNTSVAGVGTSTNHAFGLFSSGTARWNINASGHFMAATDNTYDIGASGATRPRTVYAATYFILPDGGRLGVGTATPGYPIEVTSSTVGASAVFTSTATGVASTLQVINNSSRSVTFSCYGSTAAGTFLGVTLANAGVLYYGGVGDFALGTSGASPLTLSTNDTARAKILSSGELIVGDSFTSLFSTFLIQIQHSAGCYFASKSTSSTVGTGIDMANNTNLSIFASQNASGAAGTLFGLTAANLSYIRSNTTGVFAIGTSSNADFYVITNSTTRFFWDNTGHYLAATDNSYDVGANGDSRPRSIYWGTSALAPDGTYAAAAYSFATRNNGFALCTGSNRGIDVVDTSTGYIRLCDGSQVSFGIVVAAASHIGWNSTTLAQNTNASPDVLLFRDAAATLAQRNGTNAQEFRWYRTFTDSSNYERGSLKTQAGIVELAAQTAGTGTDDLDVLLTPAGAGLVRFGTHSAIGAETVTGYVTVKDAGGTSRKLAVVS